MEIKRKQINVVWICSFANDEIRDILGTNKSLFAAPWITDLIELFRKRSDINLTIISPNYYDNSDVHFKLDNISVYLYKYKRAFIPGRAYNLTYNYNTATNSILKIFKELNPDVIHLHGSENPHYAASTLHLMKKYPLLVTIQGFVFLSAKPKNILSKYIRWNRIRFERKINTSAPYFTVAYTEGFDPIKHFITKAKLYKAHYPTTEPKVSSEDFPKKKYDIVYYARLAKGKGIEDLINAISILKSSRPEIKAIVIGGGSVKYTNYIKSLIQDKKLTDTICLAGFQNSQQEVFKLAIQAKVYVLPTHYDGIPGSIREAMAMKLPIVANAVGGIPAFNDEKESVTLAKKGDIYDLAEKINLVLDNKERTQKLVKNAYERIKGKFNNENIYENLLLIYNDILNERKKDVEKN